MYARVLIPTDGSPATDPAVEHALDIADRYDAGIHALHVVDTQALPMDVQTRSVVEALETAGRRSVESIVDLAGEHGIEPTVGAIHEGSPHEAILEYLDHHEIDLVVMASHGKQGIDRYLLGSVTERVVRNSAVPVLTVKRSEEA